MKKAILASAALAFSGAALADGPAWTYLDLGVVATESAGDDTSKGLRASGSFGVDLFHFSGSYAVINDAIPNDDYDVFRIAAGIHPAITDSTDMVLELGYSSGSYDDASAEPDGIDLTAGVRSMITDSFELNAAAVLFYGSSDTGGDDDLQDVGLRIGGQYFVTDNVSINVTATQDLSIENGSTGDSIQIGGRFNF